MAERRGRLDVDAMLAEMTSFQASEWMAFHRARPSDATRAAAQVCAVFANVMGGGERSFTAADFLPARPVETEQDPREMMAALHSMTGD